MTIPTRAFALLALLFAGCSFERAEHPQACERDSECPEGARCYGRFCIADGQGGGACAQGGSQIETCYEGPEGTMAIGACTAGQRLCVESELSDCLGQVLPAATELCNGKDDDCNGAVDDIEPGAACDSHLPGACAEGKVECRDGVEFCQPARQSQPETCNGADDDCDGMMDELAGRECYPSGDGCAMDAQGIWKCHGLCATGTTRCARGVETCVGAIMPVEEVCVGTVAQDEDCNDAIDEICPCTAGESRACYAGPLGTSGHGKCTSGMQECVGTEWGPCVGQVVPTAETCDNNDGDDDCNDVEDDVPGLGSACIAFWEEGVCRNGTYACTGSAEPRCSPGPSSLEECDEIDQDCDGDPTNGFDFSDDEMTCGACDIQCSADETCCSASCIELAALESDEDNCGACGNACGQGQTCCQGECVSYTGAMAPACACTSDCGDKACCGMNCRDLEDDNGNCGACGRKCGRDSQCQNGTCL